MSDWWRRLFGAGPRPLRGPHPSAAELGMAFNDVHADAKEHLAFEIERRMTRMSFGDYADPTKVAGVAACAAIDFYRHGLHDRLGPYCSFCRDRAQAPCR